MKISTKGRYATRALLYLAQHYGEGPISLKVISKDQDISVKYLENILRFLVVLGLVVSTKGKNGGFVLAKKPDEIKLSEIILAAEGSADPVVCVSNPSMCKRSRYCSVRDVWSELRLRTLQFLGSITLDDMIKRQALKDEICGKAAGKKAEKSQKD